MFFHCQLGIKNYYTCSLFNCCYRNWCWLNKSAVGDGLIRTPTVRKGWSERHLVWKVWSEDFFGLENLIRGNFGLEIGSEVISVWKVWSEENLGLDLNLGSLVCLLWEDFIDIWLGWKIRVKNNLTKNNREIIIVISITYLTLIFNRE